MKRYRMVVNSSAYTLNPYVASEPSSDGEWVRHADASAEIAALRSRVAELERQVAPGKVAHAMEWMRAEAEKRGIASANINSSKPWWPDLFARFDAMRDQLAAMDRGSWGYPADDPDSCHDCFESYFDSIKAELTAGCVIEWKVVAELRRERYDVRAERNDAGEIDGYTYELIDSTPQLFGKAEELDALRLELDQTRFVVASREGERDLALRENRTLRARVAELERQATEAEELSSGACRLAATLEAERDEARRLGEDAAAKYNSLIASGPTVTCAFCGTEFPPRTPTNQHEALTAHVATCEKHPMRAAEARIAELESLFDLQQKADRRAVARWQAATGRKDMLPDRSKLVTFLLERIAVLEAECMAWRDAWDGRERIANTNKVIYDDPDHYHDVTGEWYDGKTCDSCQRFLAVERARAATGPLPEKEASRAD